MLDELGREIVKKKRDKIEMLFVIKRARERSANLSDRVYKLCGASKPIPLFSPFSCCLLLTNIFPP
jgi:hypothetical protein